MILGLSIIFAFMIFILILKNCNFLFVGIFSLLIIAAISLGVGYGIALLIISLWKPFIKIFLFVVLFIIGIICIFRRSSR